MYLKNTLKAVLDDKKVLTETNKYIHEALTYFYAKRQITPSN